MVKDVIDFVVSDIQEVTTKDITGSEYRTTGLITFLFCYFSKTVLVIKSCKQFILKLNFAWQLED